MEQLIPIVLGFALLMLGSFEYFQRRDEKSDQRRDILFARFEQCRLENMRLRESLSEQKRKTLQARMIARREHKKYKIACRAYKQLKDKCAA